MKSLADYRRAAGFENADKVAKILGCSRMYVYQLEEGRMRPAEATLGDMAKMYGVSYRQAHSAWRRNRIAYLESELALLRK